MGPEAQERRLGPLGQAFALSLPTTGPVVMTDLEGDVPRGFLDGGRTYLDQPLLPGVLGQVRESKGEYE